MLLFTPSFLKLHKGVLWYESFWFIVWGIQWTPLCWRIVTYISRNLKFSEIFLHSVFYSLFLEPSLSGCWNSWFYLLSFSSFITLFFNFFPPTTEWFPQLFPISAIKSLIIGILFLISKSSFYIHVNFFLDIRSPLTSWCYCRGILGGFFPVCVFFCSLTVFISLLLFFIVFICLSYYSVYIYIVLGFP